MITLIPFSSGTDGPISAPVGDSGSSTLSGSLKESSEGSCGAWKVRLACGCAGVLFLGWRGSVSFQYPSLRAFLSVSESRRLNLV